MADPVVPNFVSGIGRLATDRFTYEKHIEGLNDRHKANQIDLFPTIVIGTAKNNVQDAIAAISTAIGTPPPDASTTVKGIVKLAGDIAGTATSVTVTKIQGKPISTSTPNAGDVLTWDGSVWKPQSITGTFANLTVTGNTTLGTSGSNTLVVNAQATLSNNLTVNGNTNLGNGGSDITTITGTLNSSGGTVNLLSTGNITLSSVNSINIASGATGSISYGGDAFLSVTNSLTITSDTTNITASTLNLSGTTNMTGSSIVIAPSLYASLNGNIQQNTGTLSINPGAGFYIYPGTSISVNSNLVMGSASKINKRYATGSDGVQTIYPGLYDVYLTPGLSIDSTYTIDETTYPGTQTGIEFEIINYSAHIVSVIGASPTFGLVAQVTASQRAVFYRKADVWALKYRTSIV